MDTAKIRVGPVTIGPRGKKKIYSADFHRDGVHCRLSLKTTNKRVASDRALAIATELNQGTFRAPPPPADLERTIADYLATLVTSDRSRRTVVKYRGNLKNFSRFLAERGITVLHKVRPADFDEWRQLRRTKVKLMTVNDESIVIKQLFKFAKSRKLILENPLADINRSYAVAPLRAVFARI